MAFNMHNRHLLSLMRQLPLYREQQKQRLWQSHPYQGLKGRTLLILGTGSIGQHLAHTGKHFGMKVLGVSRSGRERAGFDQVYQLPALNKMLAQADVIVSVLPATRETHHLFTASRFEHCKPGAILFNVGRGNAINEGDLLTALRTGKLGMAVLDVIEQQQLLHNAQSVGAYVQQRLQAQATVVVASERLGDQAHALGLQRVVRAAGPTTAQLVAAAHATLTVPAAT